MEHSTHNNMLLENGRVDFHALSGKIFDGLATRKKFLYTVIQFSMLQDKVDFPLSFDEFSTEMARPYIEGLLFDLITDVFIEPGTNHPRDISEIKTTLIQTRFVRTKKNWAKTELQFLEQGKVSHSNILQEMNAIRKQELIMKNILALHKASSIEELCERKRKQVIEWRDNADSFLNEYPYIEKKTATARKKAIEADLSVAVYRFVMEFFNGDIRNITYELGMFFLTTPIPGTDKEIRYNLQSSEPISIDGHHDVPSRVELTRMHSQKNPDDIHIDFQSKYVEDIINSGAKTISLQPIDIKLYSYICSRRKSIIPDSHEYIRVSFADITKFLGLNASTNNHQTIIKRLEKLYNLSIFLTNERQRKSRISKPTGVNSIPEGTHYRLIQTMDFSTSLNGKKYVSVQINSEIYSVFLEDKFIRIYSELLDAFQSSFVQQMFVVLEKERRRLMNNIEVITSHDFPVSFFSDCIFSLATCRKTKRIPLIQEALSEIMQLQTCISNFKIDNRKDVITVDLLPFNEYEKKDFFSGSPRKNINAPS